MGNLRLRGNTFITLLLRSGRQELSERPEWGEKRNEITRANMFADLLRMTRPDYNPPKLQSLSSYFSQYLSGQKPFSPTYYAFETSAFRTGLSMRISEEYSVVLGEIDAFYRKYLQTSAYARKLLVAGLIDTILDDDSFDGEFNVGTKVVEKNELDDVRDFILQPFLIAVWNNILMNHPDTSEGVDTYMAWTKNAGSNIARTINTKVGEDRAKIIEVSDVLPDEYMAEPVTESGSHRRDKPNASAPEMKQDKREQNQQTLIFGDGNIQIGTQISEKVVYINTINGSVSI